MEDNELYQTIEDVNRMNRTIDEMNRFNDPVQRDVIVGDWKRKKPLSKKDQRTSIIILLIFILLMVGAFVTFVYAEQPSTSERYEQLLDEETRQKWDKMNSQMEEIVQNHPRTWVTRAICHQPGLLLHKFQGGASGKDGITKCYHHSCYCSSDDMVLQASEKLSCYRCAIKSSMSFG